MTVIVFLSSPKKPLMFAIINDALRLCWIKDLVRKKEKEIKKLDNLTVPNGWIL